ncbi:hypothetical protein LEN26_014937 [Aphanomyces euteiches]|nr:hypothetical protein LEN26_014937 [Aphanomyces euteiches]KAH9106057.1 hypothetical protein AeMF1_018239 [Aphanomyces euteiches]KAH9190778.1 hypothetical protein AeNC1_007241 [Aphanomyces euteiches]
MVCGKSLAALSAALFAAVQATDNSTEASCLFDCASTNTTSCDSLSSDLQSCSPFQAICPNVTMQCTLQLDDNITLPWKNDTQVVRGCRIPQKAFTTVLACFNSSFNGSLGSYLPPQPTDDSITFPPASEPIVNGTIAPSDISTKSSSSSTQNTIIGVVGGILALAAVSLLFVYQRRRRLFGTNQPKDAEEALEEAIDVEGYILSASPKHNPRSFVESLPSERAFQSLWLNVDGSRTPPLKGSHGLLQVTLEGHKYVLKGIDTSTTSEANLFAFSQAAQSLLALPSHANVTRIFGVAFIDMSSTFAVASEFMNKGSLGAILLDKAIDLDQAQRRRMSLDIAAGLLHLHGQGITYGQLHPEKVLVHASEAPSGSFVCKLNAFAVMDQTFEANRQCPIRLGAMLAPYLAPEQRQGGQDRTMASDVYTLGVIVAQILTRKMPFEHIYHTHGFVRGDLFVLQNPSASPFEDLPADLRQVLVSCWNAAPERRPSCAHVVQALRS